MGIFNALLPLLGTLVDMFKNLFMGVFLVKTGEKQQQLKDLKKEVEQIETSKEISHSIDGMSNTELKQLLRGGRPPKDK